MRGRMRAADTGRYKTVRGRGFGGVNVTNSVDFRWVMNRAGLETRADHKIKSKL